MLVTESSCGFPIFGNGKSSRSCGCTDSSRANCSCSNTRSSHSKDIYSFQHAGRIYSPGVRGASRPRSHGVECTCSRSCCCCCCCTTDAKLSAAVQLSVVTAGREGAAVQDIEWPAWLMKATWIRLLKRAKGGHVKSSDACVSSFWVCLHHESWSDSCACACMWCSHYFMSPSTSWSQCGTISVWHSDDDDEKLRVGISYCCKVLGSCPYQLFLTLWNRVGNATSLATTHTITRTFCNKEQVCPNRHSLP